MITTGVAWFEILVGIAAVWISLHFLKNLPMSRLKDSVLFWILNLVWVLGAILIAVGGIVILP